MEHQTDRNDENISYGENDPENQIKPLHYVSLVKSLFGGYYSCVGSMFQLDNRKSIICKRDMESESQKNTLESQPQKDLVGIQYQIERQSRYIL